MRPNLLKLHAGQEYNYVHYVMVSKATTCTRLHYRAGISWLIVRAFTVKQHKGSKCTANYFKLSVRSRGRGERV